VKAGKGPDIKYFHAGEFLSILVSTWENNITITQWNLMTG